MKKKIFVVILCFFVLTQIYCQGLLGKRWDSPRPFIEITDSSQIKIDKPFQFINSYSIDSSGNIQLKERLEFDNLQSYNNAIASIYNLDVKSLEGTNQISNYNPKFFENAVGIPSPDALSITNSISSGNDKYTGALQTSIPLVDLKSYEIEVPVSLNYKSDGIMVNQIASWVGLGWSLQAGGVISRTMNSLPDECVGYNVSDGHEINNIDIYGYLDLLNHEEYDLDLENFFSMDESLKKKIGKYTDTRSLDNDQMWDTDPDVFNFKFGNYQGTFVFDQSGEIHLIEGEEQNLLLTPIIEEVNLANEIQTRMITGFEIITPDGYRYSFGGENLKATDISNILTNSNSVPLVYDMCIWEDYYGNAIIPYGNGFALEGRAYNYGNIKLNENTFDTFFSSAWHLTKIESPNGDIVDFNYTSINLSDPNKYTEKCPISRTISDYTSNIPVFYYRNSEPIQWNREFLVDYTYARRSSVSNIVVFESTNMVTFSHKLESIVTKKGEKAEFLRSNENRLDLLQDNGNGAYKLEYIKIFKGQNLQKYYRLEHTYSEPETFHEPTKIKFKVKVNGEPVDNHLNEGISDKELHAEQRRLFLDKLFEFNSNGESIKPPYEFKYNEKTLPRLNSYQQDPYGYFNENECGHRLNRIAYNSTIRCQSSGLCEHNYSEDIPRIRLRQWWNVSAINPSNGSANTESSLDFAKAGTLTEIVYPTGGSVVFDFMLKNANGHTAGIALKSKKEYPDPENENIFVETIYNYSSATFLSSIRDRFTRMIYEPSQNNSYWMPTNILLCVPKSAYSTLTKGSWIVFGSSSSNTINSSDDIKGRTVYQHNQPILREHSKTFLPDQSSGQYKKDCYPWPPQGVDRWKSGVLESKRTEITDSFLSSKEKYIYEDEDDRIDNNEIYGVVGGRTICYSNGGAESSNTYWLGYYRHRTGMSLLEQTEKSTFSSETSDENEVIVVKEDYDFDIIDSDMKQFAFLVEKSKESSKDEVINTKVFYPHNYIADEFISQGILDNLEDKDIRNIQLKNEVYIDDVLVSGEINQPDMFSINLGGSNVDLLLPRNNYVFEGDEYVKKGEITGYNKNGLPTEMKHENGNIVSIYFDEKGFVPLATAENASATELSTALNIFSPMIYDEYLETLGDLSTNELRNYWRVYNNELRERMPNAKIKTYFYDESKKLISEVEEDGNLKFYHYDDNERLAMISDMDNYIIEKYDYHYNSGVFTHDFCQYDFGRCIRFADSVFFEACEYCYTNWYNGNQNDLRYVECMETAEQDYIQDKDVCNDDLEDCVEANIKMVNESK